MNISSYYLFLTITFFTRIMGLKIIAVAIGIGILLTITAFGNGFNSVILHMQNTTELESIVKTSQ